MENNKQSHSQSHTGNSETDFIWIQMNIMHNINCLTQHFPEFDSVQK